MKALLLLKNCLCSGWTFLIGPSCCCCSCCDSVWLRSSCSATCCCWTAWMACRWLAKTPEAGAFGLPKKNFLPEWLSLIPRIGTSSVKSSTKNRSLIFAAKIFNTFSGEIYFRQNLFPSHLDRRVRSAFVLQYAKECNMRGHSDASRGRKPFLLRGCSFFKKMGQPRPFSFIFVFSNPQILQQIRMRIKTRTFFWKPHSHPNGFYWGHGPSPQPRASRSPSCSLTTATGSNQA